MVTSTAAATYAEVLVLDDYLEVPQDQAGRTPGATVLAQAKACGASHQRA